MSGLTFQCHKTIRKGEPQHCAGATIFLEANEQPNQMMRIMERLGAYDRHALDMDSPVFTDADEMIEHQRRVEPRLLPSSPISCPVCVSCSALSVLLRI
jgi:hypothetical protein